jgi:rubrerythrin
MKFRCKKCKFKFERSTEPRICPFCGSENSLFQEGEAEFKDVDEML